MQSRQPPTTPSRPSFDRISDNPLAGLYDTEIEQALLGALFINNRAYEHVVDIVRPQDFGNAVHARIFEAMGSLIEAGRVADPRVLAGLFDQDPALHDIGGMKYLSRLAASAVTVINAPSYAIQIADLAHRREIVVAAQDMIADAAAADPSRRAAQVLDDAEQKLFDIAEATARGGPEEIAAISYAALQATQEAYRKPERRTIDSGLERLDKITGGFEAGDLIVLGGRPSMGKTALAGNIAAHAAKHRHRVLIFSMEMTKQQLTQRWLAGLSGIATERQRRGQIEEGEWAELMDAQAYLADLPIAVDDQPRLSVAQMRQRARRYKRRHGLAMVIVDHLQLVRQGGKVESRRLEIGDATSSLKAVAKELGVPVIVLSQLSRAVEQRDDKRPGLSDLRESGDIEQDADIVMLLYREEYYAERALGKRRATESKEAFEAREADRLQDLEKVKGLADIIVAKNRNGRTGLAKVAWNGERQRFNDLAVV